ncbi:hypothetical protein FZI95_05670 [Mycobacterium sp. CBMA247]|nr:hypothetical protein [Mycolicibacterium sp. CBMA 329]MUL87025.1 hypothetical protein [Mycolicibacterium sp. CBMA 331]MUL98692.1 hypothetical protein [Mycolicibacterium sp. CBMA 334]MUM25555.1 hypothetical protein [Mycolicibacterium sp. CBMA 295]MUM37322.1 hypothetical protein [Mycolicibacterium sp. CBMA 247]MUM43090.1 hypothetical protein [Mycolicibacterium sp. CBMA 294]
MGAATAALVVPIVLNVTPAHAAPLPGFCVPPNVVDNVCTTRLRSVTADVVDGTITGTPVSGGAAITLAGQEDAYRKSAGFGDTPPDPVQQWDAAIDKVGNLDTSPSDPNWYGNAKARVFLPRTLNDLATQFPADSIVVRFVADDTRPDSLRLVSIQPTPAE